jgi:D-aminopeptidase
MLGTNSELDPLFLRWATSDLPGLVVGVAKAGRVLYRSGFGLANVEHGIRNSPSTRMRIGSISKHFTSVGALLLVEERKLDLESSIRRYIPELPPLNSEPSLRQLMQHTGGYRCFYDLSLLSNGYSPLPRAAHLDYMLRQHGANFQPDAEVAYNNAGYFLLSLAIERAAQQPYATFLKERIFDPLKMPDTFCVPSDLDIVPRMATLHVPSVDGTFVRGISPIGEMGEGAMVSTVDDMLVWLAHLRKPAKIGSAWLWGTLLSQPRFENGVLGTYCLGLVRKQWRGTELIYHGGGCVGAMSQMITVPAHELDIVVMTNRQDINPKALGNSVIETLIGESLSLANSPVPLPIRQTLRGNYFSTRQRKLYTFDEAEDGTFGVSINSGNPFALTMNADNKIAAESDVLGNFVFSTVDSVQDGFPNLHVSACGYDDEIGPVKIEPSQLAELRSAWEGRYYCVDVDAHAEVIALDDSLQLEIHGRYGRFAFRLTPVNGWLCKFSNLDGPFPVTGILEINAGQAPGSASLVLNSQRTRRLTFVRS